MINKQWQTTVGNITTGIWFYTLGGIFAGVFSTIALAIDPNGAMESFMSIFSDEEVAESPFAVIGDSLDYLCNLMVIIGYYFFYSSIIKFGRLQKDVADKAAAEKIKMSYVYLIIGAVLAYIPLIGGLLKFVFVIISYVQLLSGYSALKHSSTQLPEARKGASTLFSATIVTLIGGILGCLPLLGDSIEGIFTFIAFFMVLSGWNAIRRGAPEVTENEVASYMEEETRLSAKLPNPTVQAYFLLALVGISLFSSFFPFLINTCSFLSQFVFAFNSLPVLMCVVAYAFMLIYKKANVKGGSFFAICGLIFVVLVESYVPNVVAKFGLEPSEQLSMYEHIFMFMGILSLIFMMWFVLPSRLTMSLKIFILLTRSIFWFKMLNAFVELILMEYEYKFLDIIIEKGPFVVSQAFRIVFYLLMFLITALFVWQNNRTIAREEKELNVLLTHKEE